jgi:serine phosphatase RsbU (regulator of sigma subunit)
MAAPAPRIPRAHHHLCPLRSALLLFRDQRRVAEERAILAGEMQAAAEIQRLLVPQRLDVAPGLSIDAVYLPAQEVGGDFYLCRVLPDGTQRILLGDVSGKGAAAAMTAALLLGAARRCEGDRPSLLMTRLNQILRDGHISGFTTCICADVQPCGLAILANAGHLTPYKKGIEIKVESGMPLGVALDGSYPETRLQLEPGDTLTFLSDGVVEAQQASGEMFGFDRTREVSGQSARAIAEKAQSFGQADDITVLTVSRVE